jgi:hypothetical protein
MDSLKLDDIYFIFTFSIDTPTEGVIDYYKITKIIDENKCELIVYKSIKMKTNESGKYYNYKQYDVPHYESNLVKGKVCKTGSHDLSIQYRNDRRHWVSGFSIDTIYGDGDAIFIENVEDSCMDYCQELAYGMISYVLDNEGIV